MIRNQSGMAMLMVISSIAILTFLAADFAFETNINKLKSYNAQDRVQARFTAEAGLHFSLAKLRIYQEVRNKLEKNKGAQSLVKPSQVERVLTQPFIYPIPLGTKASVIQKNALKEFEEGTVLKGTLSVSMRQISGFLNPNNLRIPVPDPNDQQQNQNRDQGRDQGEGQPKSPMEITEQKLLELLEEEIRLKREQDNLFDKLYPTLQPRLLVKELKYYVNNPNALDDPEIPEIQAIYNDAGIIAKHAPMSSLDELYTLAGWPEDIINLVKDRLTVHEVGYISLNDLTENTLRLIFPNITPEQSEEFFRYRDGDPDLGEDPKPFTSVEEFKTLVVNQLAIVSSSDYDQREKDFEAANLRFGVAGKLYFVESVAKYNTASVTIKAWIDLPVKPQPKPQPNPNGQNPNGQNPNGQNPNDQIPPDNQQGGNPNGQTGQAGQNQELKVELMLPRVIEFKVE